MTNFYWPIGKISGELYIGKGAGKRLLRYVGNAQKSVKVFSPYMSASFISTLFDKSEQGLNIKCVTQIVSDTEDKYLSLIHIWRMTRTRNFRKNECVHKFFLKKIGIGNAAAFSLCTTL